MAQQTINIGASPNDGTGDTLRAGGDKINDNFTELYAADAALDTRVDSLEAADAALDSRVDALETGTAGYTDEQVRDVIAAMLQDSATIDFANVDGSDTATLNVIASAVKPTESIIVAASDETTAITAGTAKVTFRMPYAFTLSAVYAELTTAQTSGSIFTVDINEGGSSILSTKLTIDNGEDDSAQASTQPVISDTSLAARAKMTVDVDQIGDGTAKGLKITLVGSRT